VERDRYPLSRELASSVLDLRLPWRPGFQSRPQRFRGRKLGHDGTPSRRARRRQSIELFPEARSVSQTEAWR
jgi:hypothetical protein